MITFPKIRATSYAIYKRLQGFHLLPNQKGVPQTEVNMVKYPIAATFSSNKKFEIIRLKRNFLENFSEEQVTKEEKYGGFSFYPRKYTLSYKILTFGLHKWVSPLPPENRPNFFKVLYKNLTNKE